MDLAAVIKLAAWQRPTAHCAERKLDSDGQVDAYHLRRRNSE
jgi:hypothetical protein